MIFKFSPHCEESHEEARMLIVANSAFANLYLWICNDFRRWGIVTLAGGPGHFCLWGPNPGKWVICLLCSLVTGLNTGMPSSRGMRLVSPGHLQRVWPLMVIWEPNCPLLCFLMLGFLIGGTVDILGCSHISKLRISGSVPLLLWTLSSSPCVKWGSQELILACPGERVMPPQPLLGGNQADQNMREKVEHLF